MELVQDTLLAVWQKAALYHPEKGAPTTWIYPVMRNPVLRHVAASASLERRSGGRRSWPVLEYQAVEDDENDPGENDILTRQLTHYLHLLPPAQQGMIAVLSVEQTLQEIADRLQIPLGTVKSRLRLGLSQFP